MNEGLPNQENLPPSEKTKSDFLAYIKQLVENAPNRGYMANVEFILDDGREAGVEFDRRDWSQFKQRKEVVTFSFLDKPAKPGSKVMRSVDYSFFSDNTIEKHETLYDDSSITDLRALARQTLKNVEARREERGAGLPSVFDEEMQKINAALEKIVALRKRERP